MKACIYFCADMHCITPMYPEMVPREGPGEQRFGGWRGALKRAFVEIVEGRVNTKASAPTVLQLR